jgi:hypothetical protein
VLVIFKPVNLKIIFIKINLFCYSILKTIMAGIIDIIKKNDLVKILLVLVGVYFAVTFFKKEKFYIENVENVEQQMAQPEEIPSESAPVQEIPSKSEIKPNDLLPKYDDANEFAKQNPVSNLLKEQNFIVSGHHVGVNTVMQSNKIPYHDIRSAPPIPKETISPFLNSSYEQPAGSSLRQLLIL